MKNSIIYLFISIFLLLLISIGWEVYNTIDVNQSDVKTKLNAIKPINSEYILNEIIINIINKDPEFVKNFSSD
ncbi:MAG: hypothetical protein NZZ41_05780 [Candidatus Dojkabacteria bacterium]|nr:hypothetical protein [Candidatus Dojkabacteria bacterium]